MCERLEHLNGFKRALVGYLLVFEWRLAFRRLGLLLVMMSKAFILIIVIIVCILDLTYRILMSASATHFRAAFPLGFQLICWNSSRGCQNIIRGSLIWYLLLKEIWSFVFHQFIVNVTGIYFIHFYLNFDW